MDEKSPVKKWKEKRNAFYVVLIVILVVILSGLIVVLKLKKIYGDNICITTECVSSSEFYLDIINNSFNPCENFYAFSCGGYEGLISTIEESQRRVLEEFQSFITSPQHEGDSKSVKSQKKYYSICQNISSIEKDDNESLKRIFERLGGWPLLAAAWVNTYNLTRITEQCVDMGLSYDWFVDIDTAETPVGHSVLQIIAPNQKHLVKEQFRDNYQLLMENIIKRLGSKKSLDLISVSAKGVVNFELDLSQIISESGNTLTNTTVARLKHEYPSLPWSALLGNVLIDKDSNVVATVSYFPKLIRLLEHTSNSVKVNYILWKITQFLHEFLSRDIRREFEAYEEAIGSRRKKQRRSDFCYALTQTVFAYVSEAAYAKKYSPERESIKGIVVNIKNVMHDHINASKWMNQTHKTYALDKLRNIKALIVAPDEVFHEREFDRILGVDEIDILNLNNTLDIIRAVDKSRDKYNFILPRKKISYQRAKLYQEIVSIQARYIPDDNTIYIPAAIVGGIFDSHKGLNFRNYSVLGTIIAHEMAHAFGILDNFIDVNGRKSSRWSNETLVTFLNQTKCLLEQCSQFDEQGTLNETCDKTFDENFADFVSIDVSYEAFRKIKLEEVNELPGLDYTLNQLFWISYAGTMCDNFSNGTILKTKGHLEPSQRILGSYKNSRHFAKDFNCPIGSTMNPANKCIVL